jgi:hypothetical protein
MYYGMTAAPQDLDLSSGTLDLDTGVYDDGTTPTTLPSFDVAGISGVPIRVFVVKHLTLGVVTINSTSAQQNHGIGRPVAFLATGDIDLLGRVAVKSGAISMTGCNGGAGSTQSGNPGFIAGSGGGANATSGGAGAKADATTVSGGAAGTPFGSAELVPLQGGCPGGSAISAGGGGAGGGAVQLVSLTAIDVSGTLVVDGGGGARDGQGGGGGGGILLEAPTVLLRATSVVLTRGGGGGAGNAAAQAGSDGQSAPPGGVCNPANSGCGGGGDGDSTTFAMPGTAETATTCSFGTCGYSSGGGGGGRGRVRVNTLDGTFTPDPSAIVAATLTNGKLVTN